MPLSIYECVQVQVCVSACVGRLKEEKNLSAFIFYGRVATLEWGEYKTLWRSHETTELSVTSQPGISITYKTGK